jgi:hypothetical protein
MPDLWEIAVAAVAFILMVAVAWWLGGCVGRWESKDE